MSSPTDTPQSRSDVFFQEEHVAGFIHRAFTKSMGFDDEDMARPVIGICNTYSELNHCNSNLREIADAVKRGVWQAGGFPLEFPTVSLGEIYLNPTSMLYRNLAAIDTEEMIEMAAVINPVKIALSQSCCICIRVGAKPRCGASRFEPGTALKQGRRYGPDNLGAKRSEQ